MVDMKLQSIVLHNNLTARLKPTEDRNANHQSHYSVLERSEAVRSLRAIYIIGLLAICKQAYIH